MEYLTIALTKGRLAVQTLELFEKIGISCPEMRDGRSRKLIFTDEKQKIRFFLAKAGDVPTYVEYGAADLGVAGKDAILEEGRRLYEVMDLGFGRCRFALACKKGVDFFSGYRAKTVATKYPNIARQFFESRAMDVRIIKIEGSVELAPLLGLADGIVDIVETGATLRENGLEVVETITQISARLIANTASLKLRKAEIESLAARLERSIAESRGEKTV